MYLIEPIYIICASLYHLCDYLIVLIMQRTWTATNHLNINYLDCFGLRMKFELKFGPGWKFAE